MRGLAPSPAYAALLAELEAGIEQGEHRVAIRELAAANPQVTAFSDLPSTTTKEDLRKLSDLGKWAGRRAHIHDRTTLGEPGRRRKKLAIETGWDARYGEMMRAPLEPWTCPGPYAAMSLYGEIMRAPDGAYSIGDFTGPQLAHVEYMRAEELIAIGDDGRLTALGDMTRGDPGRTYPGASVPDKRAAIGKQLRGNGTSLVLAALLNISRGGTVHWSRRSEQRVLEVLGGMRLTAAQVCAEANQLKEQRRDLDGHRYLSLSTCRDILQALVDLGYITELASGKAVRRMRSWFRIPHVLARVADGILDRATEAAAAVAAWRRAKRKRKPA